MRELLPSAYCFIAPKQPPSAAISTQKHTRKTLLCMPVITILKYHTLYDLYDFNRAHHSI